jgi:hypothetical protein
MQSATSARILAVVSSLLLAATAILVFGRFGSPSTYEECIQKYLKAGMSDKVANSLRDSCRKQFPEQPSAQELQNAQDAKARGLTIQEYNRRKTRGERECAELPTEIELRDCIRSHMDGYVNATEEDIRQAAEAKQYGLTMQEYYARRAEAQSACGDAETAHDAPAYRKCYHDTLSLPKGYSWATKEDIERAASGDDGSHHPSK